MNMENLMFSQDTKGKNYLEPGQPCSNRGCASHWSYPCENCGRYAAGVANGPDIKSVMIRLRELAVADPVVYRYLEIGQRACWTNEQILAAMLLKMQEVTTETKIEMERIVSFNVMPPYNQ